MPTSTSARHASLFVLFLTAAAPLHAAADEKPAPIERFQRVDDRLYRGAQPDAEGFRYLRHLGVRTIVNLRMEADAVKTGEQNIVESLGMRYVNLPVEDGNFFTRSRRIPDDVVGKFFDIFDAPDSGPIFVHCHRGADRTGAIVSFYRIARQGWDGLRAYAEAREVGMRSWYQGLKQQIEEFSQHAERYAAAAQ
jgi:protein tyrosine/serine phosphatase